MINYDEKILYHQIQSASEIIKYFREKGIDSDGIVKIADEYEKGLRVKAAEIPKKKCTECNGMMIFHKIAIPKGRGNLYGKTGRWVCQKCFAEDYVND